ncbi:unnamed protein product [Acanthoscelides obtectus]|uniref:Uncharacterized protein n=1 Tax=Acanthoscelides obtectus TaxID=200917 RepID=A0A9P0PG92_ACAOB|nr:unnamed protein product [Acanthoscelides obtectus]CAK1650538.1 hypothetical protein AOBTE_LOCUS16800 [Acanthoscelides obtectus]
MKLTSKMSSQRVISFSAIGEFVKDDISQLQRSENAFEGGNVLKMLFGAEVLPALLSGEVAASMKKKCYTVEVILILMYMNVYFYINECSYFL